MFGIIPELKPLTQNIWHIAHPYRLFISQNLRFDDSFHHRLPQSHSVFSSLNKCNDSCQKIQRYQLKIAKEHVVVTPCLKYSLCFSYHYFLSSQLHGRSGWTSEIYPISEMPTLFLRYILYRGELFSVLMVCFLKHPRVWWINESV